MEKLKIFVFTPPLNVRPPSPVSPLSYSPKLMRHLHRRCIQYEEISWNGDISLLTRETPCLVRPSVHFHKVGLEWEDLVSYCSNKPVVVFYDDHLVGLSGEPEGDFSNLKKRVDEILLLLFRK